jgi:hypothetical protein
MTPETTSYHFMIFFIHSFILIHYIDKIIFSIFLLTFLFENFNVMKIIENIFDGYIVINLMGIPQFT